MRFYSSSQNMLFFESTILLTISFILSQNVHVAAERRKNIDAALTYASEHLLSGLNPKANPCQNFFNFTCGSWAKNFASTRYGVHEQSSIQTLRIAKLLDRVLKYYRKRRQTSDYTKWTTTFYDQCMSEQAVSKLRKIDIIVNHISKVAPLPSILQSTTPNNSTQISIWQLLGTLQRKFAVPLLFEVDIGTVVAACDQEKYVLKFSPPSKNSTITDSGVVKNTIRELAEMRHFTINANELDQKVQEMTNFAADLLNLIEKSTNATILNSSSVLESEDDDNDSVFFGQPRREEEEEGDLSELAEQEDDEKVLSYNELAHMNPRSKWSEFFGGLFGHDQVEIWNISVAYFLVVNEQYFQELQNILDQHSPETIFNYVFFTIVKTYYSAANDEMTEDPKNTSRNLGCLQLVSKYFASAITRMIFDYQKYDIMEWRTDLEMMFEMIRSAFKFLVSSADWLENDEKMHVIAKANAIQFYSGIPRWLNNDTEVNRRTFEFDPQKSIIENTLNIGTKMFDLKLDQVVHDTTDEDDEPNLEVNASYGNLIVQMFVGHILPPAYHPNYPLAVKYGDVGWVMGHELLHAFDETGVDEPVPKFNHPLLRDESRKVFERRILCLKKQLYSYCFKQKKKCVSGKHTLAETMADVDGLKVAFMAYKFSSLTLAEDPPITGLTGYSSEKIFFMTAGRSYCTSNKNLNEFLDTTEEHAPSQPRIQISMRNFPVFGRVFNCPTGSIEVPLKTCPIWGSYYTEFGRR